MPSGSIRPKSRPARKQNSPYRFLHRGQRGQRGQASKSLSGNALSVPGKCLSVPGSFRHRGQDRPVSGSSGRIAPFRPCGFRLANRTRTAAAVPVATPDGLHEVDSCCLQQQHRQGCRSAHQHGGRPPRRHRSRAASSAHRAGIADRPSRRRGAGPPAGPTPGAAARAAGAQPSSSADGPPRRHRSGVCEHDAQGRHRRPAEPAARRWATSSSRRRSPGCAGDRPPWPATSQIVREDARQDVIAGHFFSTHAGQSLSVHQARLTLRFLAHKMAAPLQ